MALCLLPSFRKNVLKLDNIKAPLILLLALQFVVKRIDGAFVA